MGRSCQQATSACHVLRPGTLSPKTFYSLVKHFSSLDLMLPPSEKPTDAPGGPQNGRDPQDSSQKYYQATAGLDEPEKCNPPHTLQAYCASFTPIIATNPEQVC